MKLLEMRLFYALLFLFINAITGWSQPGKIFTGSVQMDVLIPLINADSVVFRVQGDSAFQLKLASEVDSVHLYKGVFHSIRIPVEGGEARKFLLQIRDGENYGLYSLEKSDYFIVHGQNGYPLSQEISKLRQTLLGLSDSCEYARGWAKLAKPRKVQLTFFTTNLDKCRYLLFPRSRVGLIIGQSIWRTKSLFRDEASSAVQMMDVRYGDNFSAGLSFEWVLNRTRAGQMYIVAEPFATRQKFGLSRKEAGENFSVSTEFLRLELPLMARQFFTLGKIHPFVNAGINFAHFLSQSTIEGQAINNGSSWNWEFHETPFFQKSQFGYTLGIGVSVPLNYRRMLYFQGRATNVYDLVGEERFSYQYFTFSTGINW